MHNSLNADQFIRGLALSIARNIVGAMRPESEVLAHEGLTAQEYAEIKKNPMFQRYVDSYAADLRENGYSFAAKSKLLAEDLLPTAYHMARDPDTPAATRAKLIEDLVEWADLKPKKTADTSQGNGFSIVFNIPGAVTQITGVAAANSGANVVDVTDVMQIPEIAALPAFGKKRAPTNILLDEPDSYEYAGEDYLG
jgi:hypothetical protein